MPPPRTPARILRARGSNAVKYASQSRDGDTRDNELELPISAPKMPRGLSKYAAGRWRYLVGELMKSQILNEIDGDTLWRYVEALDDYHQLTLAKRRHRREMEKLPAAERWIDRQLMDQIRKTDAQVHTLGREFGFSPVARTRIAGGAKIKPEQTRQKVTDRGRPPRLQIMGEAKAAAR